jgi:hypothetical protein
MFLGESKSGSETLIEIRRLWLLHSGGDSRLRPELRVAFGGCSYMRVGCITSDFWYLTPLDPEVFQIGHEFG